MARWDVIVVGAGAAGMMCAAEAAKRGRSVLVLDHAKAPGEKIRISGGGRCNFTNLHTTPERFLSGNPRFAISALSRYTQHDFIRLIERHGIAYHEKSEGQLFCDGSARQVVDLLVGAMRRHGAELRLGARLEAVDRNHAGFALTVSGEAASCEALVVATGGKSIPKMGASGFGYELATRFGLKVTETRPGLVPLTLNPAQTEGLAGIAVAAAVSCGRARFEGPVLFTHRGLSGPAVLQISSYWREGDELAVAMLPDLEVAAALKRARAEHGRQALPTALGALLPQRLAAKIAAENGPDRRMGDLSDKHISRVGAAVQDWRVKPVGSEGYRTAEVTLGGVDTSELDSRTMQAEAVRGLYFIGEVVDVTGWLGGYNFQWAWSSGWAAGQVA
jgi:predicted Rossmann fold flavoprotein